MRDRDILKWYYFSDAKARKAKAVWGADFYLLSEEIGAKRKVYWLAYRGPGEIHFQLVGEDLFDAFRASAMFGRGTRADEKVLDIELHPGAKRTKIPVAPTTNDLVERIRFYWRPPSEREKQDHLTSQFYLIARGNGMFYLGHKNFYQFHLHLIPKDVYEAMKHDVLWRWRQVGISHLVGETRVEHPDEAWMMDDPEDSDHVQQARPRRAPQARRVPDSYPRGFHPKDFHLDSGLPCWCWRDGYGPSIPF
jgi:hypothetical protein